ncbi:ABC transporter substrate-binding protein [Labrenzia sp. PHM005]|uniref:substrate-binding periplasmic protein n=1 Tax=Labrenzia sp. PHM005 TaxID=2590016 RepID=UPI001FFCE73C|nr:transporter substrate-binding domain-containing protein [Labrenzia sp. PHM005]
MVKGQSFQLIVLLAGFVWVLVAPGQAASRIDIVTEDYPPYEMAEPGGGLRGFDYEVAVEAFRRMGFHADIRFLPWKRALSEAENGTTSGILTCAHHPDRERFILFSDPISVFTNGFFIRKAHDGPVIQKVEDVVGQPVASMAGYESLKVLQNLGAKPIEAQTTEIGLRMLAAGRFDYLLGAREQIEYTIRQEGLSGQFKFISLTTKDFHFCFSRNFPGVEDLVEHFNAALAEMREDGTYDAIHGKYR